MNGSSSRVRSSPQGEQIAAAGLLVLAACFVALAAWQWQRAGEARAIHESHAQTAEHPPLTRSPAPNEIGALRGRPIVLHGRYAPERQILLDNMTHQGAAGYQVLTPLRLSDGDGLVLVNRGWTPGSPDRNILPEVTVDGLERTIRGRIGLLPEPGLRLANVPVPLAPGGLIVMSFPTFAEVEQRLEHDVAPYVVLLGEDEADGYLRDWQPSALSPERHLGYAFQWLLLAILAAGIGSVVVFRSLKERR